MRKFYVYVKNAPLDSSEIKYVLIKCDDYTRADRVAYELMQMNQPVDIELEIKDYPLEIILS